jgi:hypothetical protein
MKRDVLLDPVALVQDAEDGDALRHRSDSALSRGRGRNIPRRSHSRVLLLGAAVASGERERHQQRDGKAPHAYSGIHGS